MGFKAHNYLLIKIRQMGMDQILIKIGEMKHVAESVATTPYLTLFEAYITRKV